VSWNDSVAYTEWLSEKTGETYRLPSEAEWEYAARAGSKTEYWWGDTASHAYANYGKDECCGPLKQGKDQWDFTAPVNTMAANPFGLYHILGNVSEWTCSEYASYNDGKENACISKNHASYDSALRVLRGGSWYGNPGWLRSANRDSGGPDGRDSDIGFRPARIF
jgi:formylglycine-generating enzyme required for sulfatase activity